MSLAVSQDSTSSTRVDLLESYVGCRLGMMSLVLAEEASLYCPQGTLKTVLYYVGTAKESWSWSVCC